MKHLIFLLITGFTFIQRLPAQDSLHQKLVLYKTTIQYTKGTVVQGWLGDISDSSIFLSRGLSIGRPYVNNDYREINYQDIRMPQLRRKGSVGTGILIGALGGMVIGITSGLISGDDPPGWFALTTGEKVLGGGGLGLITGGIIGGIVGALAHKTFIIRSSKTKFQEMRMTVLERIYR